LRCDGSEASAPEWARQVDVGPVIGALRRELAGGRGRLSLAGAILPTCPG
jgi:hypothetical protein